MATPEEIQQLIAAINGSGDINSILAQLQAYISGDVANRQAANKTAYEEALDKINQYYANAAQDRGTAYNDAFKNISDNLSNLGMNFADSDLAKQWDTDQRYLTESADTALANDLADLEKMQLGNNEMYNALLMDIAASRINQLAGGVSGGGGGGRGYSRGRSGGGGSSSSGWNFDPITGAPLGDLTGSLSSDAETMIYNPLLIEELENAATGNGIISPVQVEQIRSLMREAGPGGIQKVGELLEAKKQSLQEAQDAPEVRALVGSAFSGLRNNPNAIAPGAQRLTSPLFGKTVNDIKKARKSFDERNENLGNILELIGFTDQFNPNFGAVTTREKVNETSKWTRDKIKNVQQPGYVSTVPGYDDPSNPPAMVVGPAPTSSRNSSTQPAVTPRIQTQADANSPFLRAAMDAQKEAEEMRIRKQNQEMLIRAAQAQQAQQNRNQVINLGSGPTKPAAKPIASAAKKKLTTGIAKAV